MGTRRFQRAGVEKKLVDRKPDAPKAASLVFSDYRLQFYASALDRAADLQCVFWSRQRAGSDAYPGEEIYVEES